MKAIKLIMLSLVFCLILPVYVSANNREVSDIVFSQKMFKMFFSGTDHQNHPGFLVQFPYNTQVAYFKIFVDDQSQQIEILERNIVNDDSEIRFQSLYDTDYEFELSDSQQVKNISVKGYNDDDQLLEQGDFELVIPAKPKINRLLINGNPYQENMKITNPLKIDIFSNSALAKNKLLNNVVVSQGANKILVDFNVLADNHIEINAREAVMPKVPIKLIFKKYLTDINNINVFDNDVEYVFSLQDIPKKSLSVDSISIDNHDGMTLDKVFEYNNPQQVAITFNQLINYNNLRLSDIDTNSTGIYIRQKDEVSSSARLIDPEFSVIYEDGVYKSRIVFKMVGKMGYFSHEPLKDNTNYEIVIDNTLLSESNSSLEKSLVYQFVTRSVVARSYTLEADDGVLVYVKDKLQPKTTYIPAGTKIRLESKFKPDYKFKVWEFSRNFESDFGNEYNLLKPNLNNNILEFVMPATDLYIRTNYSELSAEDKQLLNDKKAEINNIIQKFKYLNTEDKDKFMALINNSDSIERMLFIKKDADNKNLVNYKELVKAEIKELKNLNDELRLKFIKELGLAIDENSVLVVLEKAKVYVPNKTKDSLNNHREFVHGVNGHLYNRKLPSTGIK